MNKEGVSKKNLILPKKKKEKAGYFTKGKFGFVKHSRSKSRSHKSTKKHRKKH